MPKDGNLVLTGATVNLKEINRPAQERLRLATAGGNTTVRSGARI